MYLKRWNYDNNYLSLLSSIEKIMPLKRVSGLANDEKLNQYILENSEGLLGEIIEITSLSAIQAIKNGNERISMEEVKITGYIQPSLRRSIDDLEAV